MARASVPRHVSLSPYLCVAGADKARTGLEYVYLMDSLEWNPPIGIWQDLPDTLRFLAIYKMRIPPFSTPIRSVTTLTISHCTLRTPLASLFEHFPALQVFAWHKSTFAGLCGTLLAMPPTLRHLLITHTAQSPFFDSDAQSMCFPPHLETFTYGCPSDREGTTVEALCRAWENGAPPQRRPLVVIQVRAGKNEGKNEDEDDFDLEEWAQAVGS